jgi:hypothetical protein
VALDLSKPQDLDQWDRDWEELQKFGSMPILWFDLGSIEMKSGCAGSIDVEVKSDLKSSEMISTGTLISNPNFIIWSNKNWLSAPFQGFSSHAIQTSGEIMKQFVRDWTASQNLP